MPEIGFPPKYSPVVINTQGVGKPYQLVFQTLVLTEPQLFVHTVVHVVFEDPRFVYHIVGPQSESQGEVGDIEEFKEQFQTLEKRLRQIEVK